MAASSSFHRDLDFLDHSVRQRAVSDGGGGGDGGATLRRRDSDVAGAMASAADLRARGSHSRRGRSGHEARNAARVPGLPSIPQRSTYRVNLPPDEVLPPCKSNFLVLSLKSQ